MARFFVDRPIVAIVIAVVTVVLGLVSMTSLPIAQYPSIIPPQIQIQTTYTGADAVTIEQSVATPLEQQMNGVEKMLYMQSTNANDGTMTLTVTFDVESEVNIDQVNAQNRVSQAQPNLPTDVNQFGITYRSTVGLPLLVLAIYSPKETYDSLFLGNFALINVNDALYRVPGVGQVVNFGLAEYSMRIWVKADKLAKLGITVPDLVRAVQQQSAVNPAGRVGAEPAPKGQELTYTVRAQGRLVTAEEFGQIVVRTNPTGSVVRLRDVARLELGALSYNQSGRFNGRPSALVAVFQAPGANALTVANGVKDLMRQLKERFPTDLDYEVGLDTSLPVTEGMKEIASTLWEAMLLVILVVFIFLQNWRATLIPLIAVPVSLIGTFAFFPFLGFSINTLSLFGLVLAIGLVVDDAIVVVEAVEHHIEEGLSPREATLKAMSEVSGPVVGIALVLSSVFIPIGLMSGIQGRLNRQFAVTIAISVLISAFNALTLSPALSALLLRPRRESKGILGRGFAAFNRGFARATHGFVDLSHLLIRKTAVGLLILGGFALRRGRAREAPADGVHPRGGPGLPADERPASRRRVLPADGRGHAQDREAAPGRARRAPRHHHQRLQPPHEDLRLLHRVLLRGARPLGGAPRSRLVLPRDPRQREPDASGRGAGGGRLRVRASRDPRHRHRRWLLVLAAGSQRGAGRVPERQPAEVPGGSAQAPGARRRPELVPGHRAAGLRRRGPRQAAQAGRAGRRRLPDAAGLPRRHLREPVQPLRTAVARLPAGGGGGPARARGHRPLPRAQRRRKHAAAHDRGEPQAHLRAGVHPALQPLSAPPRSPASPPPATAPGTRWRPSRRWRARCCRGTWVTTGPTSRTRSRRRRAGPGRCSRSRSASCS